MANRAAFIDFAQGLLNLNPLERWTPAQAKLHPFITQAKFTGPFVPPMTLKSSSSRSPAPGVQEQQRFEGMAKQRAQQQQQALAAQQAQAAQNAAYANMQMNQYAAPNPHPQPNPYNNMYAPNHQGAPHLIPRKQRRTVRRCRQCSLNSLGSMRSHRTCTLKRRRAQGGRGLQQWTSNRLPHLVSHQLCKES